MIEEEYCIMWIVQDENCPGFITIKNRFVTAIHHHANERKQFVVWSCVYRILSDSISAILLLMFPRI
jgi:hypothetical protein